MPSPTARSPRTPAKTRATRSTELSRPVKDEVADIVGWLKRNGNKSTRDGMARYAIPSDKAFGVPVGVMKKYAKQLGRNHDVAIALWETGWYEARMTAAFLGEPDRLTATEMDRWCRDFDNWAVVDHSCFHLFDKSPHAWKKVTAWSKQRGEFQKRAAYALMASLALHDKKAPDAKFHAHAQADRARRRRRTQLRQERDQLGAAVDRAAESSAQYGVGRSVATPCGIA